MPKSPKTILGSVQTILFVAPALISIGTNYTSCSNGILLFSFKYGNIIGSPLPLSKILLLGIGSVQAIYYL
jgi:hypothetical protein